MVVEPVHMVVEPPHASMISLWYSLWHMYHKLVLLVCGGSTTIQVRLPYVLSTGKPIDCTNVVASLSGVKFHRHYWLFLLCESGKS